MMTDYYSNEPYLELRQFTAENIPEAAKIDHAIRELVESSKDNFYEIPMLFTEVSTALHSSDSREKAMSERGTFKRLWDKVTGKDAKLNTSLIHDQRAASYAMQETMNRILRECVRNQELAVLIADKMDNEMKTLRGMMQVQNQSLLETRQALTAFYSRCRPKLIEIDSKLDEYARKIDALEREIAALKDRQGISASKADADILKRDKPSVIPEQNRASVSRTSYQIQPSVSPHSPQLNESQPVESKTSGSSYGVRPSGSTSTYRDTPSASPSNQTDQVATLLSLAENSADKRKAAVYYRRAAGLGDATAQYRIGIAYLYGKGVAKDRSEAQRWLLEAARQGHAFAQNVLRAEFYSSY